LPVASNLDGTEIVAVDQGSETAATTTSNIAKTLPNATTSAAGKLSATDKAKLDGIEDGATANEVGTTEGTVAAGDDARFHDSVTLAASVADVLGLTGQQVTADDPGADRLVFWDDSAGKLTHLALGDGLAITDTTLAVSSAIATLTGTQTLTNKTLGNLQETVFTITDGAGFEINPANGPLQRVTLGANRTPTFTFLEGGSMKLAIDDGTDYTVTWTGSGGPVVWVGGTAPALATTGWTHIELWREGATIYGALVGSTAS
jgi:hypothetical protein